MSSEEISLQNGLNVFQDDPLRAFNCGPTSTATTTTTRPGPKTRELTGFIDDKMFSFPPSQPPDFRSSNIYAAAAAAAASADRRDPPIHHHRNWGSSAGGGSTHSGEDESDGDDVDDEEDEDDDVDEDEGGDGDETNNNNNNNSSNININNHKNKINSGNETVNNAGTTNPEKMGNGKAKHSFVGESCRELVLKEGGSGLGQGVRESNSNNNYQNAVTIADPDGDIYYTQYLQGGEGSGGSGGGGGGGQKDIVVENGGSGCGFSGRKDVSFSSESGESLRAILSDPVTGTLMDDAMILPCGHSFGAAGIQHVLRMKVCYTCSHSVSEESVAPNLSLRAAVQAFRREEELQFYRSPKRRRERFDQDKSNYGDSNMMDPPRGRGVQFPFAVTDRVIIKGNKRTPQRFVGREAVVTTQCLNGWYVVKTLDNAESVKLQYRSLAKVPDDPSSKPMTSKMGPNWL